MDRRVVVLIPAYNEAASIGSTIQSVTAQKLPADEVLVIADNCTARKAAVAVEHGANVFVTQDNTGKKTGALNQALAETSSWPGRQRSCPGDGC